MRWAVVAPASIALGLLFSRWGVPAAWILAGITASGAVALRTGRELEINDPFYRFGRGVIGMLAGLPLVGISFPTLASLFIPGLLVAVVTIGIGVVGGLLLSRREATVSPGTGILSMLAGGASILPVLAKELGADHRFVALAQYLRLLVVSITLPLITAFFHHPGGATAEASPAQPWFLLLLIAAIAYFGEALARPLRIPVPSVLGPLLITVALGTALPQWSLLPPETFRIAAFLAIGWMCGGALSVPALQVFARQLPATVAFIIVIILACAGTAFPLAWWLDITYFEAYLATSPGALETVLALSSEGGAGPSVVAIQLIRLLTLLVVAGHLARLIRR